MRRDLDEWMAASFIALLGLIFIADYNLGWPASRTWPAVLILWGAFRAASGLLDPGAAGAAMPMSLPRRSSVFFPVLLILAGGLLLLNNYYDRFALSTLIAEAWPWILVAWGGSWMAEDAVARASDSRRPRSLGAGSIVLALLVCLLGIGAHGAFGHDGFLALWTASRY